MSTYNPRNWYWHVAGDQSRVFSSQRGDYVPVDDATFMAWVAEEGRVPTNINSEASLGEVLSPYLLRPTHASVLDGYQESQANGLIIQVNFKVLFNIMKRLNALEGKPTLTAPQARAAVKALL